MKDFVLTRKGRLLIASKAILKGKLKTGGHYGFDWEKILIQPAVASFDERLIKFLENVTGYLKKKIRRKTGRKIRPTAIGIHPITGQFPDFFSGLYVIFFR
jgi:hypothetical protein